MKRISLLFFVLAAALNLSAVQYDELWAVGSAVPGGAQRLEKVTDTDFLYTGRLQPGELRILTQKKAGKDTRALTATCPEADIVNHGLAYRETAADAEAWQVVVADDHYRFRINTRQMRVQGEVVKPWGELFIAGGATEAGWKCEGKMLLMEQDANDPYVWTWEGELKNHPQVEESRRFKFQGQDRWNPKSLHPYVQDADMLTNQRLRSGGDDTKWAIKEDGRYRITIDLFHETVKAELIKKQ